MIPHYHTYNYDRIDAAATINFSTQFGVATIREQRLLESGICRSAWVRAEKKFSEKVIIQAQGIVY